MQEEFHGNPRPANRSAFGRSAHFTDPTDARGRLARAWGVPELLGIAPWRYRPWRVPVLHRAYDGGAGEVGQVVPAMGALQKIVGERRFLFCRTIHRRTQQQ